MFYKKNDSNYKPAMEGVIYKTLVQGKNTQLGEFKLEKGKKVPEHHHPEEQTGFMISGKMIFHIGDEEFTAEPGDSWSIPTNVKHEVEIVENSVIIEVFSPPREIFSK